MSYPIKAITDLLPLADELNKRDDIQSVINSVFERRISALEDIIHAQPPIDPVEPPIDPIGDNEPDFCDIECNVKYRPHIKKKATVPGELIYFSSNSTVGNDLSMFNVGKESIKYFGLPVPPGIAKLNVNINAMNNTGIDKRVIRPNGDSQFFSGMVNYLLFENGLYPYNTCDHLWAVLKVETTDKSYYPKVFDFQGVIGETEEALNAFNSWIDGNEAGINTCTLNPDIHFTGC